MRQMLQRPEHLAAPLRFNPPPKQWRGKARLVSNSRRLTARMRRSMIVCRLNQLASQQAAKQGDVGLLRAYQPLAEAVRAMDILVQNIRQVTNTSSSTGSSVQPPATLLFDVINT